jgi:hypothetical protein
MTSFLTVVNLPTDGFGSLMEYILGAIFFCDKYGIKYIHTDLKILEHNNDLPNDVWLALWNDRIQKIFLPDVKNILEFKGNIQDINQLEYVSEFNTLFRLTNPSILKWIFDQEVNQNKILRHSIISNFINKTKDDIKDFKPNTINIAVHIRKFMKTDCDTGVWREYYEKNNHVDIFFQNVIKNLLTILPNAFVHIYSQEEKEIFNHFLDISPNICVYTSNTLMHDLVHLSHADILVMSKGSYSRLANFYSRGVKIIRERSDPTLTDKTLYISSSGALTHDQESFILSKSSVI